MRSETLGTELSIDRLKNLIRIVPTFWNAVAGCLVVALVRPILRLNGSESRALMMVLVPLAIFSTVATIYTHEKKCKTLERFLRRHRAGDASQDDYLQGFELLVNAPSAEVRMAQFWWSMIPILCILSMYFGTDTFTFSKVIVVLMSAVAAGTYSQLFSFVHLKRLLTPYRNLAATGVPDPELRDRCTKTIRVGFKLNVVTVSLVIVSSFFCVSLTQTRILKTVDKFVLDGQVAVLDGLKESAEAALMSGRDSLPNRESYASLGTTHFLIVDRETGEVVLGPDDALKRGEIQALLKTGRSEGDSSIFSTDNNFRWTTLSDGEHVLIAALRGGSLGISLDREIFFMTMVTIVFVVAAILGVQALSRDLVRSTEHLGAQVRRVAAQDLTRGDVFESEDDLGELARGVDRMSISLRDTILSVTASADRVEEAADKIEDAAKDVSQSSSDQESSIARVTESIESISGHAEAIQDSAASLETAVEDSSATISNLSGTGDRLARSGTLLVEKVGHASEAFQTMFSSIGMVEESSGILSNAADGTMGGVEEMASALRQVESNAVETSKLSDAVVENAEKGRDKMEQTIRGIESVQEDTQMAEAIVRELSESTDRIGSIVDVIESVADRTSLLALNAAIIAAQAGEHGRSFAVVAGEIKSLAARVLSSTKEIADVIDSVQSGTQRAVTAIERGRRSVDAGVELAKDAGGSLAEINRSAMESGARMREVVRAVQEQSKAAQEVAKLMASVTEAVARIETASREQNDRTNEVVNSNEQMSSAASEVRQSTEEQVSSFERISGAVETVGVVAAKIYGALREQSASVMEVARLMKDVNQRAHENEVSTQRMSGSVKSLTDEAANLHQNVQRFKL
jgi:methyl-accepting chemotaxis protein